MENNRDSLGYILLEKLKIEKAEYLKGLSGNFSFFYNNKKYFFKKCKNIHEVYNELIAEEIANEFGIPCAHYDLASYYGFIGTVSENFINRKDNYITIEEILKKVFKKENVSKYNNLEDIEISLIYLYKDQLIVNQLMNELINIFIFDILIANLDRHVSNNGIIENENGIHFGKVFDNEKMLSDASINMGIYSLGISRNDYHPFILDYNEDDNFIKKFLYQSSKEYKKLLEDKLEIISDENIEKILVKVEQKINSPIQPNIREKIKLKFSQNLSMIEQILNQRKIYKK